MNNRFFILRYKQRNQRINMDTYTKRVARKTLYQIMQLYAGKDVGVSFYYNFFFYFENQSLLKPQGVIFFGRCQKSASIHS